MISIRVKSVKKSGVKRALMELQKRIGIPVGENFPEIVAKCQGFARTIIVPNIRERWGESGEGHRFNRSNWRVDTELPGGENFQRKHYKEGGVSLISKAIDVDKNVEATQYTLYFGVGNLKRLDEAAKLSEDDKGLGSGYSLFQILEFGTGMFSTFPERMEDAGTKPVTRGVITRISGPGKNYQVFPWRTFDNRMVQTLVTKNPGQMARNAFLMADGSFYSSDLQFISKVAHYIIRSVHELSYSKGG